METAALIFITALIAFVALFLSWKKKGQNLPPGPIGLPFVGYIPFLTNKPYVKLQELAKIYGPVYRIQMGSKPVVVLCDFQTIKNAFANDDFMGRPPDFFNDLSEDTLRTGAFLDLPWKEQRRFCLHMLRDLGFGKTRMEELLKELSEGYTGTPGKTGCKSIRLNSQSRYLCGKCLNEEILEFLQCIEDYHGSPVKLAELLTSSTSNNIAALIFGRVLKLSDPKRQKLDNELNEVGRIAGALFWQIFFPWIAAVMTFFNLGDKGKLSRALAEVKKYCSMSAYIAYGCTDRFSKNIPGITIHSEEMEDHEKTLDPNNIRDFVDGYLLEIKKKADEPNTTFKRGVLPDIARGFFGAGSETVRLSVEWTMLVCAAFPEVQMKIQQEIDDVIGQERFPTRTDHLQMPYTEAVILELGRWKTILPLNIMRRTLKDTELNGYFIPKNTHILAVIWAVHHDKKLWGNDTDVFRPERFLSEDGKKVIKPEYYIPFSIGKRACPGKSFAEVEVFLYVTALLQKFNVSMPPGTRPDLEGILGIGLQPKRLELILKLRKR